jgi:hypothetical protein
MECSSILVAIDPLRRTPAAPTCNKLIILSEKMQPALRKAGCNSATHGFVAREAGDAFPASVALLEISGPELSFLRKFRQN